MTVNTDVQALIDKAVNEAEAATITYQSWHDRVVSGWYASRKVDPFTQTSWGRFLAAAQNAKGLLNVAPAPPPPPTASGLRKGAQFHAMWGYYSSTALMQDTVTKLHAAGITDVRVDVGWDGIEDAAKGARNSAYLSKFDTAVSLAQQAGMRVLVTLWLTPGWARGNQNTDRWPPTNPQDYADFAHWLSARMAGKVDLWEVWNEPNPNQASFMPLPRSAGNDAQRTAAYAALLKGVYPGFKAGNPNCRVVLGAPDTMDYVWLEQLYQQGVKGSFDIVGMHGYQGIANAAPDHPTDGNVWWLESWPLVRQTMAKWNDVKPAMFTEFGWSAGPNTSGVANWQLQVSEATQAQYARDAVSLIRSWPEVEAVYWYKDRGWAAQADPFQSGYALIREDGSVRPALAAYGSA